MTQRSTSKNPVRPLALLLSFYLLSVAGVAQITPGAGNILYVDIAKKDVPSHSPTGDSWDNAIPELADALKWAGEEWGTDGAGASWDAGNPLKIYVAKGTYLPLYKAAEINRNNEETTDRDKAFVLVPETQLYGGFDPENNVVSPEDERILPGGAIEAVRVEAGGQEEIQLYPNPALKKATVVLPGNRTGYVQVSNLLGRGLTTAVVTGSAALDVSAWLPGVYMVQVLEEGKVTVKKLVVE